MSFLDRLALWVIVAGVFTTCEVQHSRRHGRLLLPPTYDDVVYLNDALQRLETAYQGGPVAVAAEYVARPPHSPFSSFLALVAFACFGVTEWAPYAANVLVVVAALVLLDVLTGPMPTAGKLACASILLSIPIMGLAVVEFRPDLACGLLTAGAVTALLLSVEASQARSSLLAGALFGLALLAKPAIFVVTVPVAALSFVLAAVCGRWDPARPASSRRELGLAIALGGAIAMPHFALTLPRYLSYFEDAIFARRKPIEPMRGTLADHLTFYLWGQGGEFAFGSQLPLLLALMIAGTVLLVRAGRPPRWPRLAAAGLIVLAAFAIPTASPVKQPFLGAQFAFLVVLVSFVVFARGVMTLPRPLAIATSVIIAAVAAAAFSWPRSFPRARPEEVAPRNALPRRIYDEWVGRLDSQESRLYVTTTGFLGPDLLRYMALKDRRPGLLAASEALSDDVASHAREMDRSDFVLASEPGVAEPSPYLPTTRIQAETLALVRSRPDYVEIAGFPSSAGPAYFLYQRIGPFFGWKAGPGWLPVEGPYPHWQLPLVRWACHPSAVVRPTGTGGPPAAVVFTARVDVPDQVVRLSIAGRPFHVHRFSAIHGQFERVRIPWPAGEPPAPVLLSFATWNPADPLQKRAVLFKTLQVLPAGE